MALPLQNLAAGTDGGIVTTGNSAVAPSTAWSAISAGTATILYSTTRSQEGASSLAFTQSGVLGASYVEWATAAVGAQTVLFGRVYIYFTVNPASAQTFIRFLNGANVCGGFAINTNGVIFSQAGAAGATTSGTASVNSIPLNTWVRVEFTFTPGASGSGSAKFYTGTTSVDPGVNSSTFFSATTTAAQTAVDTVRFGLFVGGTTSSTYWMDNFQLNATAVPGPGRLPYYQMMTGVG